MTRFERLLTTLAIAALPAAVQAQSIAGEWWGAVDAAGMKMRYAIHVAAGPDGKLGGTLDSLDAASAPAALVDVVLSGNRLEFACKDYPGRFEGSWDAAAKGWRGNWLMGGQSYPMVLGAGKAPADWILR